ncbi:hypothetical protein [Dyadobacter sp. CY323]|uniref:hypothetical protein n=1 Tax=Dyadobacter sp. CY323 TaxID=2907302 RepID=UPI001F16153E|nr:hypothetical protein [Dyadobacter sp. CY323]MCE6993122.1 hypothetical protein [Dyadobacter sp. CY323]
MNIKDAKSIPLDEFLENLGQVCVKESYGRKWYKAPWREEKTASFVLTRDKQAWFDHAIGAGGNIIDLALKYANLDGIPEALKFIENTVGSGYTIPTIRQELKPVEPELPYYDLISANDFNIYSGRSLSKNAQYLTSRGIDPKAVAPYLKDVKFTGRADRKKSYSGFGMQNNSGGFEVRRAGDWAKTSVGHKDVSVFLADRDFAPWHTFYSMIDFCTFLTIDKPPIGTYNYLIVNGDAMIGRAAEGNKPEIIGHAERFIETIPPGTMIHYPHDDSWKNGIKTDLPIEKNSGLRAFNRLLDFVTHLGWGGGDMAYKYDGFKDWNEKREKDLGLDRKVVGMPQQSKPDPSTVPYFKL